MSETSEIIKKIKDLQGTYAGLLIYMLKDLYDSLRWGGVDDVEQSLQSLIIFLPNDIKDFARDRYAEIKVYIGSHKGVDRYSTWTVQNRAARPLYKHLADEISTKLENKGLYFKAPIQPKRPSRTPLSWEE